jgi:hypothetical protein
MENPMRTHVAVIGWINLICGIPGLILGIALALGIALPGFVAVPALPFLAGAGFLVALYFALGVIVGIGLLQGAPWARVLAIVLAILHLINASTFGISTIFGIYSLYILFHPKTERLFNRGY